MARPMTLNQLIRKTYLKILKQFLLCLFIFYLIPLSVSTVDNLNEQNVGRFALFFNASSWIYLCLIFVVILICNIQKLLKIIRKDMETVYHKSLYLEQNENHKQPSIQEFIETNQHINTMQGKIQDMIANEQEQKKELMFQVSAAAHDLKTPLTVIRGNSEYLQSLDLPLQVKMCLEDIESSSQQLDDYFNQFIQYSKTFYHSEITLQTHSLQEVLEGVSKQIRPLLTSEDTFEVNNLLPTGIQIQLNLDLFSRAIQNIVSNALTHHDGDQTAIILTVSQEGTSLNFSIWNSHSTLSKDLLEFAGTLFYQEDLSRKKSQGQHYGLGLAFVKRVAQLHHGEMELANENGGAVVRFVLPLAKST